jgi:CDP-diacylglycerol--serine O-phosphatidyltransferase
MIKRYIPNTVTCLNLFSGCIAGVMAFEAQYELALFFMLLSALFDFFDGMLARTLKATSVIGKELDSLADDISFGLVPALIAFSLLKDPQLAYPTFLSGARVWLPYAAFLIAVFSALRLAKFNIDERQTGSFIGLPTPANALFWASLAAGGKTLLFAHCNVIPLLLLILLFSALLVSEIKMFSLKFKNASWKSNQVSYIFLIGAVPLILIFEVSGIALIILWYILLSALTQRK